LPQSLMKILFLTQFLPYPPDTGGKIKTYQTIKLLSKKHQIYLISFVEKEGDLKWEKKLKRFCYGVKTFVTPIITTSHQELKLKMLSGILNPKPFRIQKYSLKETADFTKDLTGKEIFEAIHCDHETSVQYLFSVDNWRGKMKVYDEHNLSSEGLFGYLKYEKNLLEKLAYLIEAIKFRIYEKKYCLVFDQVLTISENDKEQLIKLGIKPKKINFFPVPFETQPLFKFGSKNLLFVGLLSWWPNQDGVLWFYRQIFPKIKKRFPKTKFIVVGANPPKEILKISKIDHSVIVTGYVDELDPFYQKSGVFVVPIRAGAGIRIKILEALARGIPIVSTKMAAKGIGLENKKEILLAEKEKEFAQAVIRILKKERLAYKLSLNGVKFVKKNYHYQKGGEVLDRVYLEKGK